MEETRQTPEIVKKWREEATRYDREHPREDKESSKASPLLSALSWSFMAIGALALAIMIYDGKVLHVCFEWRKWLFLILFVSSLPALRAIWDGEDLWQTNERGKKRIRPSIVRAAFRLTLGIAGFICHAMITTRPGIKMIYPDRHEYVQPTADSPEDYWIVKQNDGALYKGMSKQYTYGSGRRGHTERQKEGFGMQQFANGDYYIGMWKEGTYTFGLYVWNDSNKSAYFGAFHWNEEAEKYEITGRGVYFYNNGYTFDGTFKNGTEEGWGHAYYPDGVRAYAHFKQGKRTEQQEPVWRYQYIGWFDANDTTGYGRYYYPQGGFYQGWFKHGKFNGPGRLADIRNHTIAERDWKMADPRGDAEQLLRAANAQAQEAIQAYRNSQARLAANARQRSGYKPQPDTPVPSTASKSSTKTRKKHPAEEALPLEAFLTQPDPSARRIISYKGKLVAQKPEGKAQATFDNGDVYNGEWHKGLREGYGEIKYANGDEYKGEWKADKRTGKGYYFKGPYDYVKGDFVDGKPHGLAIRYVNGVRVYNGRWVEGVPQKTGIRASARGKSE